MDLHGLAHTIRRAAVHAFSLALLMGLLGLSLSVAAQQPPASATTSHPDTPLDLHLEVFLHGISTRWIAPVRQWPDGRLWMPPDHVQHVGLRLVASAVREDDWVELTALPGVQTRYEERTQSLYIQAEDTAMTLRVLDAQTWQPPAGLTDAPPETEHHTGMFINHTLSWQSGGTGWGGLRRYQSASGLLEGHVYGRFGTLSSAHILSTRRWGDTLHQSVRLDTQWSWFDENRLLTVSAGDFVSSSLPWSRSVRLAGVQIRRNFAIRPDLITMPTLSGLSGSAAVPATVEVYVNDARYFSQDVAPGPFTITNLPLITGGGTARLVVRDALGRETISETPFYASSNLLAQGLSDFALETGVARRRYGTQSHDYDRRLLTSATVRYGLNNATTLEGHAQFGARLMHAGAGAVFRLGTLGVAALAASASRYGVAGQHETGTQFAGNLELEWGWARVFMRSQHTFGAFNDLASITLPRKTTTLARRLAAPPRSMQQISLGFPRLTQPSLSVSYTPMRRYDGNRTRVFGLSTSYHLARYGYLSVSSYRDFSRPNSLSVFVGLSWFLGDRLSASNTFSYSQGNRMQATVDLSRSEAAAYGSMGWRVRAARGQNRIGGAQVSYRSHIGRIQADVARTNGTMSGNMSVDGAVVLAGSGVFLSNQIHNAFAVVNVGAPHVPVHYENNLIGQTDTRGQILLAGLRAYERNLITIDPMRLPVDTHIPITRRIVSPRYRSGTVVDFRVATQPRVALITVHDETGKIMPVGTGARLNDGTETLIVGYDGQIWLENIAHTNRLLLQPAGKPACVVTFTGPPALTQRLAIPDAICRSLP